MEVCNNKEREKPTAEIYGSIKKVKKTGGGSSQRLVVGRVGMEKEKLVKGSSQKKRKFFEEESKTNGVNLNAIGVVDVGSVPAKKEKKKKGLGQGSILSYFPNRDLVWYFQTEFRK